jgi:hypothetical protein
MRSKLLFIFIFISFASNAQISQFLKSSEFERIKAQVTKIPFNNITAIWVGDAKNADEPPTITSNSYILDLGDITNRIYLDKDFVIFSYHLSAGSNTGTLIYHRLTQNIKTYNFYALDLKGRILNIQQEGYKNGHWWQQGNMNLANNAISWSKHIDR